MFEIFFTPPSLKELAILPRAVAIAVRMAAEKYLTGAPHLPKPPRLKKLHHFRPPLYRLRVGDYRVYYRIDQRTVIILAVLNRRDADRWLGRQ